MTAPLDEKARDAALAAWFANTAQGWHVAMESAIRAYLAASPSPSEMDCDPDGCRAHIDAFMQRAEAAEAQVLRLTEENEALRKERTSLIETKREQIDRVTADQDHNAAEYEKVLKSYADENQCFSDKLESAEARIKALEEALNQIDALDPEDHVFGVSHDACRGLIIRMGQIARTTLQKEQADG